MRNILLAGCAVISLVLIASLFHGPKQETWSIPVGHALYIATPCAASVSIAPDPGLQGAIRIVAKAREKAQITQLKTVGGPTALISGVGSHCLGSSLCAESQSVCQGQPGDPSLKLALSVPVGIAIGITEAAGTDYEIGDVGGALTLNLAGSGDVDAARATGLTVTLAGSGDAHVASVSGPVVATLSDRGDLDIADAAAASAKLTLNGDGDVNVSAGSVGALTAALSHDGDLHVPGAAETEVSLTAYGDVDIAKVTGNLTASLTGDGDLSVGSVGGDADVSSTGDGDVTIAHVAGHVAAANSGDGDMKVNGS
jgi:hypothetical protein